MVSLRQIDAGATASSKLLALVCGNEFFSNTLRDANAFGGCRIVSHHLHQVVLFTAN